MKINQTIKERRKERGLTQEQIAEYLGITAPAVNKWEKGTTYPDITLLPALARLLKTDLNTLLSFHEDLTNVEIGNFVNELDKTVREQGFAAAFETAVNKINEYPTCEILIASVAPYLAGALSIYCVPQPEPYVKQLEKLYLRIVKSENVKVRELATGLLISDSMQRQDYLKAEELIHSLQGTSIDKEEYLATLYAKQGKYTEAVQIWERSILQAVAKIQSALMGEMEIAVKENRTEDAEFLAGQ